MRGRPESATAQPAGASKVTRMSSPVRNALTLSGVEPGLVDTDEQAPIL